LVLARFRKGVEVLLRSLLDSVTGVNVTWLKHVENDCGTMKEREIYTLVHLVKFSPSFLRSTTIYDELIITIVNGNPIKCERPSSRCRRIT